MKFPKPKNRNGIALVMVMIVIMALSILAGAFALSMKVETKLARNASSETQLIWLGRSGVEYARYVLAQSMTTPNQPYDSLNQIWAGGPGSANETNSVLNGISLTDVKVGDGSAGTFSIKITDLERKFNINIAGQDILQQALVSMGVDASEIPTVVDSVLDWIDTDDDPHMNGAESDYYQQQDPPYFAKNGPIDDLQELLMVKGVTAPIYWGPDYMDHVVPSYQTRDKFGRQESMPTNSVGLVDLFTPISSGKVNINTASASVLQLLGMDETTAKLIVQQRAGPDGQDGTDDDVPFSNIGEAATVGLSAQAVQQLQRSCSVRSATFAVEVTAHVGDYSKTFYAILGRTSPTDVQILSFHWK
jgi:general secretion pathway protein K